MRQIMYSFHADFHAQLHKEFRVYAVQLGGPGNQLGPDLRLWSVAMSKAFIMPVQLSRPRFNTHIQSVSGMIVKVCSSISYHCVAGNFSPA
jgi:hypothetical protein